MAKERHSAKGAEALFAAAFTYAFTGVLVRVVAPMWGTDAQVASRWIVAFILLLGIAYFQKDKDRVPRTKLGAGLANSIFFALVVLFFTAAVERTTIANTLFIFYATNMTISFLLGTFLLKEAVTTIKIIAILCAVAGLGVYANAILQGNAGLLLSIGAGVSEAICNMLRKRLSSVPRGAVLRLQFGFGSVFTTLVTLFSGEQIVKHADLYLSFMTLVFGAVIALIGYLVLYGYRHFDVNIGSVIVSTELVFGAILGWLFFNEVPARHEIIGGTLIFLGAVLGSGVFDQKLKAARFRSGLP